MAIQELNNFNGREFINIIKTRCKINNNKHATMNGNDYNYMNNKITPYYMGRYKTQTVRLKYLTT